MESFSWFRFWIEQEKAFNEVMKISTIYFARKIESYFGIESGDEILDYGCGPGFLFDHLESKRVQLTGADISPLFIEEGKKNHPNMLFIGITTDLDTNKRILNEHIGSKRFDYIILLSLVQYFKNIQELENVIKMLASFLKMDGKIIIADVIDHETSSVRDALALFIQCVKKGKVIAFFRFIFYLLSSDYNTLRRKLQLLKVSEQSINQIADNNSLDCKKMKAFTIHTTRKTYVMSHG